MTATTENKTVTKSVQEVCIDLPGETVQCWRSADNIKVILRKHRDVIFDINQGDNKTYTVEATDSDFYNARDKKLVYAKRRGTVTFKDGERLSLRVSRGFKGAFLLKSDGVMLMRIEPNELDKHQHGDDPKEKPAPIIIALGKGKAPQSPAAAATPLNTSHPPAVVKAINQSLPLSAQVKPSSASVDDCHIPTVCVVDGSVKDMPEKWVAYFKKGGGNSGLADIDPNDVATRNWIWGQIAGTTAYVAENWKWLRGSLDSKTHEGFKLVQARVHYVRGKVRFYFSGYSNANTVYGRGGHGAGHERTMNIFAGAGKTESSFKSVAKGVAGTFKSYALVSFVFGSSTAIAEWKDDIKKDNYDLAAALFTATIKSIVAVALTVVMVAALVMFVMIWLGAAIPVIVVGLITIAAGIGLSYLVDASDKELGKMATDDANNTDGLASVIAPWMREAGKTIEGSWQYLMEKFPKDYKELSF